MADKIDPGVLASSAVIDAQFSSKIEVMKRSGKSEDEIVTESLRYTQEQILQTHKLSIFMKALSLMCKRMEKEGIDTSGTTLGYNLFRAGFTDKPEALIWGKTVKESKTLRELWLYFLAVNGVSKQLIRNLDAYDHVFFECLLNTPVLQFKHFGFNASECV
jgi:hypothetical protein